MLFRHPPHVPGMKQLSVQESQCLCSRLDLEFCQFPLVVDVVHLEVVLRVSILAMVIRSEAETATIDMTSQQLKYLYM